MRKPLPIGTVSGVGSRGGGGGSKSSRPDPANPLPSHSRVFSSPRAISGPCSVNRLAEGLRKMSEINQLQNSEPAEAPEKPYYSSFVSQADLPGIPAPTRACMRCGAAVPAPRRNGRPRAFCSDACRLAQAGEQRRSWAAENPDAVARPTSLPCKACGKPFMPPPSRRGRWPAFCSPTCRRQAKQDREAAYRRRKTRLS